MPVKLLRTGQSKKKRAGLSAAEEAVKNLMQNKFTKEAFDPPTREMKPGDRIDFGNLVGCEIVELFYQGRVVVFRHLLRPSRETPNPAKYGYIAAPWFYCPPLETVRRMELAKEQLTYGLTSRSLEGVMRHVFYKDVRFENEFQRGYVWTQYDKYRFIESVMHGIDLGKMVLIVNSYPDVHYDVVDGKQRLTTLRDYMYGLFTVQGKHWHELTHLDRQMMGSRLVHIVELDRRNIKPSYIYRLYLEINAACVPQTQEHLEHVTSLYTKAILNEGSKK